VNGGGGDAVIPGRETRRGRQAGTGDSSDGESSESGGSDGSSLGDGADSYDDSDSSSGGGCGQLPSDSDDDGADGGSHAAAAAASAGRAHVPVGARVRLFESAGDCAGAHGSDIPHLDSAMGTVTTAEYDSETEAYGYTVDVETGPDHPHIRAMVLYLESGDFEEMRADTDGAWYSRDEFAEEYGRDDYEESWLVAGRFETRLGDDGEHYSFEEFVQYYGVAHGLAEWRVAFDDDAEFYERRGGRCQ
jgi:hypothetical protein